MDIVIGIAVAAVTGVIATMSQAYISKFVNQLKRERSYARVSSRPGNDVGNVVHLWSPDAGGGSALLGGCRWKIQEVSSAGVWLLGMDGDYEGCNCRIEITEYEAATPIVFKDA